MSMLKILSYVNTIGANPHTNILTRKELSTEIRKRYSDTGYKTLQECWKLNYIRYGRLWGFVLTKKGFDKYIELGDKKGYI